MASNGFGISLSRDKERGHPSGRGSTTLFALSERGVERALDLNELCIRHPAATYFVRVEGDSMIEAGVFANDILVVDRAVEADHGDMVIAELYGELTVRELALRPTLRLLPRNGGYPPVAIPEGAELNIFGVVTHVVRNLCPRV